MNHAETIEQLRAVIADTVRLVEAKDEVIKGHALIIAEQTKAVEAFLDNLQELFPDRETFPDCALDLADAFGIIIASTCEDPWCKGCDNEYCERRCITCGQTNLTEYKCPSDQEACIACCNCDEHEGITTSETSID